MNPAMLATSFWRVCALISALCAIIFISTQPQVSNDFWLQAKVGELIVRNHAIPHTLLFPFTEVANRTFNAHEWLPSVLFYCMLQLAGESGLPLILGAAGALLFVVVTYFASTRARMNLALGLVCGWVAIVAENYRHFLRPELLSLFVFLAFWHCLERSRERLSFGLIVCLLGLELVWANTHGSFILGPLIAGLYAIGIWIDGHRYPKMNAAGSNGPASRFAWLSAASLLITLANPQGVEMLRFVFDFSNSTLVKGFIIEWTPTLDPRLRHSPAVWVGLGSALGMLLISLWRWRSVSMVDVLILLLFTALGLRAYRFLIYLGLITALLLPKLCPASLQSVRAQRHLYQFVALFSGLVLGWSFHFGNMNGNFPYQSNTSEVLTSTMKAALTSPAMSGNVYTSYDLGAELVYRSYPRLRPSIDSRIDSYGDSYFLEHEALLSDGALMAHFIGKYKVRYMLLTRDDFGICQRQHCWGSYDWQILAEDHRAILLERMGWRAPSAAQLH